MYTLNVCFVLYKSTFRFFVWFLWSLLPHSPSHPHTIYICSNLYEIVQKLLRMSSGGFSCKLGGLSALSPTLVMMREVPTITHTSYTYTALLRITAGTSSPYPSHRNGTQHQIFLYMIILYIFDPHVNDVWSLFVLVLIAWPCKRLCVHHPRWRCNA